MADLDERLSALEHDRTSGAMSLAIEAARIAEAWVRQGREPAGLVRRLRLMHPAIAAVANVGNALERGEELAQLQASLEGGNQRIAEGLARRIAPDQFVVTISNSSTVREALLTRLEPRGVLALASEPGGEGRAFAEVLAKRGVRVSLEPDSAMGRVVAEEADVILVGADSFDQARNLVHKVGTLPLALCARQFGKPFYAAGHSIKRVATQLVRQPADQRFDLTPGDLLTALVTEEG